MRHDAGDAFSEIRSRISGNPWIHLREVSAQVDIGRNRAQRIIKQAAGMTFRQMRQVCRLCRSIEWLLSGVSVKSAALGCGYGSAQHYARAFKRLFAVAPSALRPRPSVFRKESANGAYVALDFSCPFGCCMAICHPKVSSSSSSESTSFTGPSWSQPKQLGK